NAQVDKLRFGTVEAHAQGDRRKQVADLRIDELGGGSLRARATIEPAAQPALTASVRADKLDIGFARALVPRMREIRGKLRLSLAAQGSLAQPMPRGQLQLRDGQLGPAGAATPARGR